MEFCKELEDTTVCNWDLVALLFGLSTRLVLLFIQAFAKIIEKSLTSWANFFCKALKKLVSFSYQTWLPSSSQQWKGKKKSVFLIKWQRRNDILLETIFLSFSTHVKILRTRYRNFLEISWYTNQINNNEVMKTKPKIKSVSIFFILNQLLFNYHTHPWNYTFKWKTCGQSPWSKRIGFWSQAVLIFKNIKTGIKNKVKWSRKDNKVNWSRK